MEDDIIPGASYIVDERDFGAWRRWIFTDEAFWDYRPDEPELCWYRICKFPFVPGFFLCKLVDDDNSDPGTHYPVAGPFRTLKGAMTACIVLGPQEDAFPE